MADPGITRRLRGITGVASVNLVGAIERELVVEIRPRDLQASRRQRRPGGAGAAVAEPGRRRWAGSKASSTSGRSA